MIEDSNSRIKEWAATSLKSILSLSHEIFEGAASEVSSSSLLLRHLFYFLKNAGWTQTPKLHHLQDMLSLTVSHSGGDYIRVCIQLWMQRSCSDQPSTNSALKNLGR
jgi:hypothetical protein